MKSLFDIKKRKKLLLFFAAIILVSFGTNSFSMKRKRDEYNDRKDKKKQRKIANNSEPSCIRITNSKNILDLIKNGEYKKLKELLDKKPSLANTEIVYSGGSKTPLVWAIKNFKSKKASDHDGKNTCSDIIKLLIDKGANPSIRGSHTDYPVVSLCNCRQDLEDDVIEVLRYLIDKGNAHVNSIDESFKSPLATAIKTSKIKIEVLRYLIDQGNAHVNSIDESFKSPLATAIKTSKIKIAKLLISKGATYNNKLLYTAAGHSNLETVKFLVEEKKIDIHALYATVNVTGTPLFNAVKKNKIKIAEYLIEQGAHVNQRNKEGETPLHYCKSKAMAQLLIKNGANANLKNRSGNIANPFRNSEYDVSRINPANKKTLEVLQKYGANINDGYSSLENSIIAAAIGDIDTVKRLIQNGVRLNYKGKELRRDKTNSIVFQATLQNHFFNLFELVKLLLKNGAKLDRNEKETYEYPTTSPGLSLIEIIKKRALVTPLFEESYNKIAKYLEENFQNQEMLTNNLKLLSETFNTLKPKIIKAATEHLNKTKSYLNKLTKLNPENLQEIKNRLREPYHKIILALRNTPHNEDLLKKRSTLIHIDKAIHRIENITRCIHELRTPLGEKTASQILKNDLRFLFYHYLKKEDFSGIAIDDMINIKNEILNIITKLKNTPTFDKIAALSYLAAIRVIDNKGKREELLSKAELIECLKHIPYNYYVLHNKKCKYLRCRILQLGDTNSTRDINGTTITEALCNYPDYIPQVFCRKSETFFGFNREKNRLDATGNLDGILFSNNTFKKNIHTQITDNNYEHKYLFKLADKIEPLTKKNVTADLDKSYRNNPYHKKFVNSCSLYSLLCDKIKCDQGIVPKELVNKIIGYTDGKFTNIKREHLTIGIPKNNPPYWKAPKGDASFLPSRELLPRIKEIEKHKEEYLSQRKR